MPVTVQWDQDEPLTGQPDAGSAQKVYPAAGAGTVTITDEAIGGETITLTYTVPLGLTTVEPSPAQVDASGDAEARTTVVAGEGFPASTSGTIAIATGPAGSYGTTVVSAPVATNAAGVFTGATLTIPSGQAAGDYHIEATFGSVADLQAALTVIDNSLAAPTGLASPTQTANAIELTWSAVDGATGYIVQWKPTDSETWNAQPAVTEATDTVAGLQPETSYDFQVQAQGDGGATSPWSATFTIATAAEQTPLPAPEAFAAGTATATTVPFTWETVTGADSYTIQWRTEGGEWTQVPDIASSPYTVEGLTADTAYEFQIKALGDGFLDSDWAPQPPLAATTASLPQLATPQAAVGTVEATSVEITWAAIENAEQYVIRWAQTGQTDWTEEPPVADPATSGTVTDLTTGQGYDFQVQARADGWAASEWSATVAATPA